MAPYTINPPTILINMDPNSTNLVWYNVNGNEIPLTIKMPVKNLADSASVLGSLPWLLLNVKKSSLLLSIDDATILGKGATKNMRITHSGFQLLYRAHDNKINKNPDAKNADKKMILFNGFMLIGRNKCNYVLWN